MSNPAVRLRILRPLLLDRAVHRLTRGEGLRATAADQLARFFELLEASVERGNAAWLNPCLEEWVRSRTSGTATGEILTFLPVLRAVKTATWYVLRENLSPEEALETIVALEPSFDHAWSYLSSLEAEALLNETATRLREAHANLRRLEKSKSDFVAVAAHELKTPLTLIEGYASMLADGETVDNEFLLAGINKGIGRLKEIVEDMLDVSLVDNGLLSLSFQPVRLRSLFERLQADLERPLKERRQVMTIADFDDGGAPTLADPKRILQVFRNIVWNAIKFTPDGGRITVSARQLPGFVDVSVADTGIGIAADNQQRIFEKFVPMGDVSLHSTGRTKFKGGGAGLGLAIAKGLIEAHGGTVWCESPGYDEENCPGSTFHIMVPKREGAPGAIPDPADVALTPQPLNNFNLT